MALGICEVGDERGLEQLSEWFEEYFATHPDALAGCHLGLDASADWVARHPAEMTAYDRPVNFSTARVAEPSWASEVWRKDSADFVEKCVRLLHQRFSGRIIVYQIGAGACHENVPVLNPMSGYYRGGWYCGDFSEPMLRYFRRWLKERYTGDDHALRRAWSDANVSLKTAQIPARAERLTTEWFSFRSPLRSQTADYYEATSDAIEDCVIAWAKAVKRASSNEALAASPMGAILDVGINSNLVHQLLKNSLRRSLQCPELDIVQAPASYVLRDLDVGDTSAMIPLGSLKLSGKMWLRDLDSRTSIVRNRSKTTHGLWRMPESVREDEQLLKRDVGYSLLKGGAFWWHEIDVGMYGDRVHCQAAERLQVIGDVLLNVDRSTPPGLAVLVDNAANYRQANANRLIYAMNYEARQLRWSRTGMAHEVYHVADISRAHMPAHRVILATNLFTISDEQVRQIHSFARRHSATIIWTVAPGVQTTAGFDLDRASRITGFRLRSIDIEAEPMISMCPGEHPLSRPLLDDGRPLQQFGGGPTEGDDGGSRTIGPMFYADVDEDRGATVLGTLDILGKPGLVFRERDGVRTIYCAASHLHQSLLRAIGQASGAHVYSKCNDIVHATPQLMLLKSDTAGRKEIQWPEPPECVLDLWTGQPIEHKDSAWAVESRANETHLFFAGPNSIGEGLRISLKQ
jgi:hypothetical protein